MLVVVEVVLVQLILHVQKQLQVVVEQVYTQLLVLVVFLPYQQIIKILI